jgi:hypothetical protein
MLCFIVFAAIAERSETLFQVVAECRHADEIVG